MKKNPSTSEEAFYDVANNITRCHKKPLGRDYYEWNGAAIDYKS